MPIVYVHGVATRDDATDYAANIQRIKTFVRRFIAPVIAADPDNVEFFPVYWGDVGVKFSWDLASRPRSPLLGQGGVAEGSAVERAMAVATAKELLAGLPVGGASPRATGGLLAGGGAAGAPPLRLATLDPRTLSNLLVVVIERSATSDPAQQALLTLAADEIAYALDTHAQLAGCADSAAEIALLQTLIAQRYTQLRGGGLLGQGAASWFQAITDRLSEAVSRADDLPGFVLTRAAAEARGQIHAHVALFLGDVLTYIKERRTADDPGPIPTRVMDRLAEARDNQTKRGGEPLIVLSHSMGGQLIYDLVTHFLPQTTMPEYTGIRIDFWCATASQVGLFEELKQFQASSRLYGKDMPPAMASLVPFPSRRYLGGWWNVWDHNDFISFTAHNIIDGVDDEPYDSGMSGLTAHSGYLMYPSFFRTFASKLNDAKERNWWRP